MAIRIRRDSWQDDRQYDEIRTIAKEIETLSDKRIFIAENVTTTQKNAIVNPGVGRIVFDTDLDKLCVYTSGGWETISSS
jgi:hypothetical protein